MGSNAKLNYVITTAKGCVPYIVNLDKEMFNKIKKVYLDDMLFKDSFYDKDHKCPLRSFIGSNCEVAIGFRGKPSILTSKRGNYKLTEKRYEDVLQAMECTLSASFNTGILTINNEEVIEPADLDDFNKLVEDRCLFGTQFINSLTDNGNMLYIDDRNVLCLKHLNDTDFEYQKYLFSINEMNAFNFISENNYKVFHDYIEMKSKSE